MLIEAASSPLRGSVKDLAAGYRYENVVSQAAYIYAYVGVTESEVPVQVAAQDVALAGFSALDLKGSLEAGQRWAVLQEGYSSIGVRS